jgi:hypothetical protein
VPGYFQFGIFLTNVSPINVKSVLGCWLMKLNHKIGKTKNKTLATSFFNIDFFGNMKKMQCIRKQLENLILVKFFLGEFWENDCKYIE